MQPNIYIHAKNDSSICYPFPKETRILVIKGSIRGPMKLIEHIKHMNEKEERKHVNKKEGRATPARFPVFQLNPSIKKKKREKRKRIQTKCLRQM